MVKRARGSVRPGQRRPINRRPSAPAGTTAQRSTGLSDAELARAEELERQLLAEERAAEAARRRTAERTTVRQVGETRTMSFEDEYAYVARDVKDIVRIAALLIGILLLLYILIDVLGVISIG
jgi:hypothetical protein